MGGEWREYKISDVGKVITGKTPPGTLEKYFGGETLFVTPGDMGEQKFIEETARTLSASGEVLLKKYFLIGVLLFPALGGKWGSQRLSNSELLPTSR